MRMPLNLIPGISFKNELGNFTVYGRRKDLMERLRYTFMTSRFEEIDVLIDGLKKKDNFPDLCEELFAECRISEKGELVMGGFFGNSNGNSSLHYAMYEILGTAPNDFLLKSRVTTVSLIRSTLKGRFRLPRALFALPDLKQLIIKGIGISRLPQSVKGASMLESLDLSSNRFIRVPDSVCGLKRLKSLNMAFNLIDSLQNNISGMYALTSLNLSGNKLGSLPEEIGLLYNLQKLNLSMNVLQSLPECISNLPSLRHMQVSFNAMPASREVYWENQVKWEEPKIEGVAGR